MKKLAVIAGRDMFSAEQLTKLTFAGVNEFYEERGVIQRQINKLASQAEVLGFSLATFPKYGWGYLGEILNRHESIKGLVLDVMEVDENTAKIARERGIVVMTLHDYQYRATVEGAIEAILSTSKEVKHQEVRGRSLGVIGEGKAGEEIAQLAKALGMNVSMWSREVTRVDKVKRVSKNEILTTSEYIVVAVSDCEANRELIGREEVETMSEEAVVINVAGRGTVNEQVIKQAVKLGKIASYAYKQIPLTEESQARRVAEFVKNMTGMAGRGSS